jgi:acyl carrier protein
MTDRLLNVVSQVLGVSIENLSDADSPASIESWDSIAHINLVVALEAEFEISFSSDDAVEMLSVEAIRKILLKRGIA